MTSAELAALPVGTIVRLIYDDEISDEGEIIQAGQTVQILWPDSKCTNIIDTNSKKWQTFIKALVVEEA